MITLKIFFLVTILSILGISDYSLCDSLGIAAHVNGVATLTDIPGVSFLNMSYNPVIYYVNDRFILPSLYNNLDRVTYVHQDITVTTKILFTSDIVFNGFRDKVNNYHYNNVSILESLSINTFDAVTLEDTVNITKVGSVEGYTSIIR